MRKTVKSSHRMNTLPYRALVEHTEEPIQLAWGGTQVQNTPTFFKEVELPIELDKLEGSPRSIAAHKQYGLVLAELAPYPFRQDGGTQQEDIETSKLGSRALPLILGKVVIFIKAVLSLCFLYHPGPSTTLQLCSN